MRTAWYDAFTIIGIPVHVTGTPYNINNIKKLYTLFDEIYMKDNELDVIHYMPSINNRMESIETYTELMSFVQFAIGIKLDNRSKLADITSAFQKVRLYAEQHLNKFIEAGFMIEGEPLLLSASDGVYILDVIRDEIRDENS